jgi:hypothetical protein
MENFSESQLAINTLKIGFHLKLFITSTSVPALEAAVAQPGIDTVNAETSNDEESLEHVNNIDINNTNKDLETNTDEFESRDLEDVKASITIASVANITSPEPAIQHGLALPQ